MNARTTCRLSGSARIVAVLACALALGGCSWVGGLFGADETAEVTSVFDIKPGQCFNPPSDVKAEISDLAQVRCDQPHVQEAYLVTAYVPPSGAADSFPGDTALTSFADGACAEAFTGYVGVSYLDSSLFYTFVLPSARSWEQASDRQVICFITTTGEQLTASVAGSKK